MTNLRNRTIQIAGSCSKKNATNIVNYSHGLVKLVAKQLFENGACVLTSVGSEPLLNDSDLSSPSIIFYWDILETAFEFSQTSKFKEKPIIKIVSSEKAENKIPPNRNKLWNDLLDNCVISLSSTPPGWNAGAYIRQKQEELSDSLLILGGGEGVEHLSFLYLSSGKSVVPLDIPLGSSTDDGLGGAPLIYRKALSDTDKFHIINDTHKSQLRGLKYERWKDRPEEYSSHIISFLNEIIRPQVFYVRLMNHEHSDYVPVEQFFREVVDPAVGQLGYKINEVGSSQRKYPFINLEIFSELSFSSIVIVDMTGLRPNCFMEMGYAFGKNKRVILTARKNTIIPFDPCSIPCFFWNTEKHMGNQIEPFIEHWKINVDRPPIVQISNLF